MKVLVITPDRNVRKVDYTGAFLPESMAFAKYMEGLGHAVETFRFDASATMRARRESTIEFLAKHSDAEFISFFCHGAPRSIQAGLTAQTIGNYAEYMQNAKHILLMACLTAKDGRDGFAAALHQNTPATIVAHSTAGHTTKNPNVTVFSEDHHLDGAYNPKVVRKSISDDGWIKTKLEMVGFR